MQIRATKWSRISRWISAAVLAFSTCIATAQQTYPTAPIRLVVGTPAGGTSDIIARLIAQKMSESLRQQVIVENRSGASGLIAAEGVAKGAADGYTLLLASSQLATFRALYPATTLDPQRDFEAVGLIATSPYVMVVHPSLAVKSLPELLAYAKANPGKLSYAGSTPGTAQHLGWEMIKKKTGVDMQYVPYKGTSALMPDLLSGRLQAGIDNVAVLTPYVKNGQLRGIAVTGSNRSALLPDLPTVAASGVPDFQATGWFGVFAPAKVPPSVLTSLKTAVRAAVVSTDTKEKLVGMGAEPQNGTAEEMRDLLRRETTVWSKVILDAGITPQ
jgi:tripartite-type tricarboxylate transporter receptor subunit TctC